MGKKGYKRSTSVGLTPKIPLLILVKLKSIVNISSSLLNQLGLLTKVGVRIER